jgi:hypothetical protein
MERDSSFASRPPDLASFESSSPPLVSANKDARHRGVRRVLRAGFHAPFQDFGFQTETAADTRRRIGQERQHMCFADTLGPGTGPQAFQQIGSHVVYGRVARGHARVLRPRAKAALTWKALK